MGHHVPKCVRFKLRLIADINVRSDLYHPAGTDLTTLDGDVLLDWTKGETHGH